MSDQRPEDQYGWLYGGGDDPRPAASSPRRAPDLPPPNLPPPGGGTRRRDDAPRGGGGRSGRRRLGPGRVLLILLMAWVLFLVVVPLYAYTSIPKVDHEPDGTRPDAQRGSTFLLVGTDSRAGLTDEQREELSTGGDDGGRGRTDTILLLHSGAGPSILLSIPRDSIVDVPGYGSSKINAAYAFGGPQLLTQTVEQSTGIRVDDYVEIGFGGLVDVVDAVGGIEICPEEAIEDADSGLDVEAGCQEADGATALGFARVRKPFQTQDIQRVQNQREVMSGIASEVASPWTVVNPLRYWGVNTGAAGSVSVGETTNPYDLLKFALALRGAMGANGLSCTVPVADFTVRWDPERSQQVFQHIAQDRTQRIGDLCTEDGLPAD